MLLGQTLPILQQNEPARFNSSDRITLPGADKRSVVIGANGTGKTVFGAWLLSKQRFSERPWVILDYKNEELWDLVGDPPLRYLKVGELPAKRGLYRMPVRPDQDDILENWLWKIWHRENVGLLCDEVGLLPKGSAFKAILRQGRSKRIPVIACTQRPVDVDREVFTESNYVCIFRVDDLRDHKVIQMFTRGAPTDRQLPPYWSYYYDKGKNQLSILKPVSSPDIVAARLREAAPYSYLWGW